MCEHKRRHFCSLGMERVGEVLFMFRYHKHWINQWNKAFCSSDSILHWKWPQFPALFPFLNSINNVQTMCMDKRTFTCWSGVYLVTRYLLLINNTISLCYFEHFRSSKVREMRKIYLCIFHFSSSAILNFDENLMR